MRFLADMGVSGRVVGWLRQRGFDVSSLAELGLQRMPDGEIFAKCAAEGRVLLTFDLDFGEILAMSEGVVVSVVLFRLNDASPVFVTERLNTVLNDLGESLAAHDGAGVIVVVEDGRHRIRRLPIGS